MYEKITYRVDGREVNEKDAVREGIYSKYYYLHDKSIDKIEMINMGNIFKVVYPQREPPFDNVFERHFEQYPETTIQININEQNTQDGGYNYRTYIYSAQKELLYIKDCYENSSDNLVKEIELDNAGNILVIYMYYYNDEGNLIKIIELDGNNNIVGEQEFD